MYAIQHDSPTPIHEQLAGQIAAHIATGALRPGARLAEHRAFAQELLANPQAVARAYQELEASGILVKSADGTGTMVVTAGAVVICQDRLRDAAIQRIKDAIDFAVGCHLADADVQQAVERALAASRAPRLAPHEVLDAIRKPSYDGSHRPSEGIQDLSRKTRSG